jgi:hypothetical protein
MTNSSRGRRLEGLDLILDDIFLKPFESTTGFNIRDMYELMFPDMLGESVARQILPATEVNMFTELIFKNHIIAERQIVMGTADMMVVKIYDIVNRVSFPELMRGSLVFSRGFSGGMSALIRHSANWVEKLEREYRGPYWNDEREEWGISSEEQRVFFREPTSAVEFAARVTGALGGPTTIPRTPGLSPEAVATAFQNALDHFPVPPSQRRNVMDLFVQGLTSGAPR